MATTKINENDTETLFCCSAFSDKVCESMVEEHLFGYVMSGEMTLLTNDKRIKIRNGEAVFIRRSHLVRKLKQPTRDGKPFKGLFLRLNTDFLRKTASQIVLPTAIPDKKKNNALYYYIPQHPFLTGLFQSLDQYFTTGQYPVRELVEAKLREAILVLLQLKPELVSVLFDFVDPWKPDLADFMNNNFVSDLSVEQFAHYTGRSLSSFKRDFSELYHETPNRWIIKRRLEEAYTLLKQEKATPSEIYLKVGFKNFSHFSTAFKKQFGISPSSI